jgi:tetratricopeptide (TPR) repeat protein
MAEVLDSAARRISVEPPREPEIEASLQSAIGASYTALGKFSAAEPHLLRALQLRERHPEDRAALSNAVGDVADLSDERGDFVRADTLYRRALAILPASRDTAIARRAANLVNQIARMESQQGHYDSSVALLHRAITQRSALYGPSSGEVGRTMSDLGLTLLQKGDLVAAESVQTRAVGIIRHAMPVDRGSLGNAIGRLATNLELNGNRNAADSAYRESIDLMSSALGPDHPDVTYIRYNYAGALLSWNHAAAAVEIANQVLSLRGGTLPDTHPMVAGALITRGQALGRLGKHSEAERSMREALALRQRNLPPGHWLIGSVESILGDELWAGGKRDEGMRLMREGCRSVTTALGPGSPRTTDARGRLARAGDSTSCR